MSFKNEKNIRNQYEQPGHISGSLVYMHVGSSMKENHYM